MNSNNLDYRIESINNTNKKIDVFSLINDNSIKKKNNNHSLSSQYILTNYKNEKGKQNELILPSKSDKNIYESENMDNSKSFSENGNKNQLYNILVAVRCRPLSKKEKEISTKETVKIINDKTLKLKDPYGFLNPNNVRAKEKIINFDFVFSSLVEQEQIFNSTTKFLIDKVVNGFNATVFAYGVTGAGKTYTMLGTEDNPGIMVWAFKELYKKINEFKNREYIIKLWYAEIYNENIRDLLSNKNEKSENLDLREDPDEGIIINNITEVITNSMKEILNLIIKGNKNRTVEETDANKTSSRSHAILQIKVSFKEKNNGINNNKDIKFGKLNLIDLAGSERAGNTKNKGLRLIEGANINKSLLTLGNCINALAEKTQKGSKIYIPYRDSKLTRILKDSLGGNSRTVMIANISPFIYNFDDTYNTLKYAERAKCIKTKVKINIAENNKSNDFTKLIKSLNNKLNKLGTQLKFENKNTNVNLNNDNMNIRINSIKFKQHSFNKRKRNTYNFHENTFSDNDIKIKSEMTNIKVIKNQCFSINNTNDKSKENKSSIDLTDEFIKEKDKKISLIIEDYIQQSEAEIQLKQKIVNIQYNLLLLYNTIKKNIILKKNNSEDKIKLKNMKKMLDQNIECLNEMSERNENFIKKYIENNSEINNEDDIEFNFLQKQYIYVIFKNTKIQKENIEIKFKYTIMKNEYEKKNNYIKEFEKQVKLRDLIIKELLYYDNNLKTNSKYNENDNDMNSVMCDILKKEKNIKYKRLSELKDEINISIFKEEKNSDREINLNKTNSIYLNNNKFGTCFYQSTNGSNNEYFHKRDNNYFIDFDKQKSQISNSYINLKIPTLIKSNSSFNFDKFDRKTQKKNLNQNINNKPERESEKSTSKIPYKKYINESNSSDMNYRIVELEKNNKEENSKKIKSILNKINNMNNEISSKMSIIEQQTNRNRKVIGITGQITNKINTAVFINNINKEDNLIQINQNNEKRNLIKEKTSLKKIILENLTKENNDLNYKINLQINNNKITKRKSKNKNNNKNLIKSEQNKNYKILNCKKIASTSIYKKIDLSRDKSADKLKERNKILKNSKSKNNSTETKSFISLNQDNLNKKKFFEKNNSAINIINIKKAKMNNISKKENENKKNQKKNINIKMIKDNMNSNKKYNTIYITTNFNDKNQVIVQSKASVLNKRNKDKKMKIERFINIDQ